MHTLSSLCCAKGRIANTSIYGAPNLLLEPRACWVGPDLESGPGKTDLYADDAAAVYSNVSSRCRSAMPVGNYGPVDGRPKGKEYARCGTPAPRQTTTQLQSCYGLAVSCYRLRRSSDVVFSRLLR